LPLIPDHSHLIPMQIAGQRNLKRVLLKALALFLLAIVFNAAEPTLAQAPAIPASPVDPLPPDTGAAGLKQMLLRLQTTARLMQTTAHPDDEDGGMLTFYSRGMGVRVAMLTLKPCGLFSVPSAKPGFPSSIPTVRTPFVLVGGGA